MFLLRCPKCKHDMKYQSQTAILSGKRKTCVYCGNNFSVREQIVKVIGKDL